LAEVAYGGPERARHVVEAREEQAHERIHVVERSASGHVDRRAGPIPHAVGVCVLEVAPDLDVVLARRPGEARGHVPVRVRIRGDGIACDTSDVPEVAHVDGGNAEIERVEGAGVEAEALGIDLVRLLPQHLPESRVADPGLPYLVVAERRGPGKTGEI